MCVCVLAVCACSVCLRCVLAVCACSMCPGPYVPAYVPVHMCQPYVAICAWFFPIHMCQRMCLRRVYHVCLVVCAECGFRACVWCTQCAMVVGRNVVTGGISAVRASHWSSGVGRNVARGPSHEWAMSRFANSLRIAELLWVAQN